MKRILPLLFLAMSLPLFAQNVLPSGIYSISGGSCTQSSYFNCARIAIRDSVGTAVGTVGYLLYSNGGGGSVTIYNSSGYEQSATVAAGDTDFNFNFSNSGSFSGSVTNAIYAYHRTCSRGYCHVWYSLSSGTLTIN
jgi:hypothetical protein